jgi:uncharacterized protein with von Willebrand factor type A (vWA) domain
MVKLIQQFVSCCRASGLRVSTSEVLDSLNQLQLIDPIDELQFRSLLCANLAKSVRDVRHFDRLYHLFFHEMRMDIGDMRQAAFHSDQIKKSAQILKQMPHDNPIYDAVVEFMEGNPLALLSEMRRIRTEAEATMLRFNLGPLGNRLNVMIQINKAASAAGALIEESYTKTDSAAGRDLAAYFEERVAAARSILMNEPRPGDTGSKITNTEEQRLKGLGEKSFSSFTREEVEEMREAIDKLVRKLKNLASRRFSARSRGNIDVKKTLRASAKYNGVPVEIKYRLRRNVKAGLLHCAMCPVPSGRRRVLC